MHYGQGRSWLGLPASSNGRLLQKVTYPDNGVGDRGYVKHAYNAPSQLLWTEDRATNVLGDAYDAFDGEALRRVITRGSGSDGALMPVLTLSDAKQFCDHYTAALWDEFERSLGRRCNELLERCCKPGSGSN